MADVNNNTPAVETQEDLRGQDREKNTSILSQITGKDKRPSKKTGKETYRRSNKQGRKKRWQVVTDIIVAILMIAFIGGLVVGGYYIFRYFSDDYETVDVTYTFIIPKDELEGATVAVKTLAGRAIYCDSDGNTHYFGKISSAEVTAEGDLVLSVDVTAKYRSEEGHLVDGISLAVGMDYTLRTEYNGMNGTIVRLEEKK